MKKHRQIKRNNKGITLIALIVTVLVLVLIAGVTIAALTSDNGVMRQANQAKVTQIEGTAREKMDLACSAIRLAVAEASVNDNSYSAKENAAEIQEMLYNTVKADSNGTEAEGWKVGLLNAAEGKFVITYEGEDYKNACNDPDAKIQYTVTLGQKSIEVTDVATGLTGPDGSNTIIDIGSGEQIGSGSGSGEIEEHEHTSDTGTVTTEATCSSFGVKKYKCTSCGAIIKTETIAKLAHTAVNVGTAAVHSECTTCGAVVSATHSYSDSVTTEPTCSVAGVSTHTCACGYSYTTEIAAKGHTENSGEVTTAATCTETGEKTYKCTVCSATTRTETIAIDSSNHTGETSTGYENTNETQHSVNTICSGCSAILASTLENHSFDAGVITTKPTVSTDGVKTYTCSVCKGTKTETIAKGTLGYIASIGQYVNYDPTDVVEADTGKTSYTSNVGSTTSHGNGYGEQKFSAAAYKESGGKWQILDIDENGTITLISDAIYRDNVDGTAMLEASDTNGLYLQNGIGYLWAEEELHRIGAIYGYGKGADTSKTIEYYYGGPNDQDGSITAGTVEAQQGRKTTLKVDGTEEILTSGARAITADDIHKICGKDTTYTANYSMNTVTKVSKNAKYYPTLVNAADTTTGKSAVQTSFSGSYYNTICGYKISSTNSDTTIAESQNSMLINGKEYWLGSRFVNTNSSVTNYDVYMVTSSGLIGAHIPCSCDSDSWYSNSGSEAVRSVVTLQSGIQTPDTEYNESTGWNLT